MLKIYNYMTGALVLTGLTAFFSAHSPVMLSAMYQVENDMIVGMKPLAWLVTLAPLGLVFFLSFGLQRMTVAALRSPIGRIPPSWACRCPSSFSPTPMRASRALSSSPPAPSPG
jgi:FtsH-binding integral membrane protein